MINKTNFSKLFFVLSSLVLILYFFASFPYSNSNNLMATQGSWCVKEIIEQDMSINPQYYNSGGLIEEVNNEVATVLIFNEYQLGYWAYCINENLHNFSDKNVKLMNNIDLWDHYWTPVESFSKLFDGQGFNISYMWINFKESSSGFIGAGFIGELTGTIYNVNFVNCGFEQDCEPGCYVGFVAGIASNPAEIEGCNVTFTSDHASKNRIRFVKLTTETDTHFWFGGIVGKINDSTIKKCFVEDQTNSIHFNFSSFTNNIKTNLSWSGIGGVVGESYGNSTITLCSSNINILGINNINEVCVGGIVGKTNDSTTVTKSCNYGDITVGGTSALKSTIQNAYVGGIVGDCNSIGIIENLYNVGDISGYVLSNFYSDVEDLDFVITQHENDELITLHPADYVPQPQKNEYECPMSFCDYSVETYDFNVEISEHYNKSQKSYKENGSACYKGGIIGLIESSDFIINNCYNRGEIDASGSIRRDNYHIFVELIKLNYINETFSHFRGDDCHIFEIRKPALKVHGVDYMVFMHEYSVAGNIYGFAKNGISSLDNVFYEENINNDHYLAEIDDPYNNVPYDYDYLTNNKNIVYNSIVLATSSIKIRCAYSQTTKGMTYLTNIDDELVVVGTVYLDSRINYKKNDTDAIKMNSNWKSKLSDEVWGNINCEFKNINNGYPYLREMYWVEAFGKPESVGFTYECSGDNATLTKVDIAGDIKKVIVPQNVVQGGKTYTVTTIGPEAFAKETTITEVVLPNTITTIESKAFYDCNNLININMPAKLTTISNQAFDLCKKLNNVKLPNSLKTIGKLAFASCNAFTEIVVPNNVTTIGERAFGWTYNLKKLTTPFIGAKSDATGEQALLGYMFGDSANEEKLFTITQRYSATDNTVKRLSYIPKQLSSIVITGGDTINSFAFYGCAMITSITLPTTIKTISSYAFDGCKSLKRMHLPENLETIGNYAFASCNVLEGIDLPYTIKTIGQGAFGWCYALTTLDLSNCTKLTTIPYRFLYNNNLTSVKLPKTITTIGKEAFYNCSSLTEINLPRNLIKIGESAFKECRLLSKINYSNTSDNWNKVSKLNECIPVGVKIVCTDKTITIS